MFKAILGFLRCEKCLPQEDTGRIRAESDSNINEENDDLARKDTLGKDNSCTDLTSSAFLSINGNSSNDLVRNETTHHGSNYLIQDKFRIEHTEDLNTSSYIKISGYSGRGIVKQDSSGAIVKKCELSDDLTTDDDIQSTFVKENTPTVVFVVEDTTLSDLTTDNIVHDDLVKEDPTACISARENDKTSNPGRQETTFCKFVREKTANLFIADASSLDPILEESTPSDQKSEETTMFVGQQNDEYKLENNRNVTSINGGNSDEVGEYTDKCETESSSHTQKPNTAVSLKADTKLFIGSGFYDNNVDWSEYLSIRRGVNEFCRSVSHPNEKGTLTIRNEIKHTFKANLSVGSDADYHNESDITDKSSNTMNSIGDNVRTKPFKYRDECKTVSVNHKQKTNRADILKPDAEVIIVSGFYDNNIDWSKYSLKLTGENDCCTESLIHVIEDNLETKPISCTNEAEENFGGIIRESQQAHKYETMAGEHFDRMNEASLLVHSDCKSEESQPVHEYKNIKTEVHSGRESEASQLVHEYENIIGEHFDRINEASLLVHSEESQSVHEYQNFKHLMNRQYTSEHISTPKTIDIVDHGNMAVCYVKEHESNRNSKEFISINDESQTEAQFETNKHLMQDQYSSDNTSTSENIEANDKANNKDCCLVQYELDANGREAIVNKRFCNTNASGDGEHFIICSSYIIGRIPRKASEDN